MNIFQRSVTCSYCGGEKFYEGPSGGMSTNILCANKDCRHWFNYSPVGVEDLKRIEPTVDEKVAAAKKAEVDAYNWRQKTWQEGVMLFQQGKNALSCVSPDPNNAGYRPRGDDIVRLAGWLDAMEDKHSKDLDNVKRRNK